MKIYLQIKNTTFPFTQKTESCAYNALSTLIFAEASIYKLLLQLLHDICPVDIVYNLWLSVCVGMQNTGCPCTMCLNTCGPYHHTDQALTSCVKRYTTGIAITHNHIKCTVCMHSTGRPMGKLLFLIPACHIYRYT